MVNTSTAISKSTFDLVNTMLLTRCRVGSDLNQAGNLNGPITSLGDARHGSGLAARRCWRTN